MVVFYGHNYTNLDRCEYVLAIVSVESGSDAGSTGIGRTSTIDAIRCFWDERSRGYSLSTRILLNDKEDRDRRLFNELVPASRQLKVLDLGTGAGYAAIILAQMGHDVTAIDNSEQMLSRAQANARDYGVDIAFMQADICDLARLIDPFSFDLVVAKDVVWDLTDPVGAYSEWIRLIRPGGYLLVIDGNYYLELYDEDYARAQRYYEMKYGAGSDLHSRTNIDHVDLERIRDIARALPLSRERRPSWDVSVLLGLGFVDIRVVSRDPIFYSVLTRDGMMKLPAMFAVQARTPFDKSVDEVRARVLDGEIGRISAWLSGRNMSEAIVLKALSDRNRAMIVMALSTGSLNVSEISSITGDSVSSVSHNLKILKDANIVYSSKEGKESYYNLTNRRSVDLILMACKHILDADYRPLILYYL